MSRFKTLVMGTTLGLAALGLSAAASAGVRFGVDVAVPVPAVAVGAPVVAAPVVAAGPLAVGYRPGPYYGPHFYAGAPYYGRNFGPAHGYSRGPVGGWHAGYGFRDGHVWRR
jgi:hypothetical protein